MTSCFKSRNGVALVMVLWIMTILCAVALEVSFLSRLRLQATRNSGDGLRALFIAKAGVEHAIAELKAEPNKIVTVENLREGTERAYCNVQVGQGSYTLLAEGADPITGEPVFGISDEAAKIDLSKADESVLSKVPGIDPELAADIVQLRQENGTIHDLDDLLLIETMDVFSLYGEDQNRNGILDPNEDDGDESWPPDDYNGELDRGLAPYLTCYSSARNVTSEGEERVNINTASAQDISSKAPQITQQQADSIVEHRKKNQLNGIADLLDVMLVEKIVARTGGGSSGGAGQGTQSGGQARPSGRGGAGATGSAGASAGSEARPSQGSGQSGAAESGQQPTVRTTNKKAFDVEKFKAIADLVTTSEEDVLQGVVNINTAPPEVLACLPGMDDALAADVTASRPEGGFQSIAELLDVPGMTTDRFKQICNLVSARSDVFSVRSFGVLNAPDGTPSVSCCISAVIDRTGESVKLKSWRELR